MNEKFAVLQAEAIRLIQSQLSTEDEFDFMVWALTSATFFLALHPHWIVPFMELLERQLLRIATDSLSSTETQH